MPAWLAGFFPIYWDFNAHPSLGFTKSGPKKKKYPVNGSFLGKNALFMADAEGKWPDQFELTISKINISYNQDMRKSFSECTTR